MDTVYREAWTPYTDRLGHRIQTGLDTVYREAYILCTERRGYCRQIGLNTVYRQASCTATQICFAHINFKASTLQRQLCSVNFGASTLERRLWSVGITLGGISCFLVPGTCGLGLRDLSHRLYLLSSFRKSIPSQNRQLAVYYY